MNVKISVFVICVEAIIYLLLYKLSQACNFFKKRLWRRCFPVNFEKFLRAFFLQNISGRLILHSNDLNFSTWVFFLLWVLNSVLNIRFYQWIITNDMMSGKLMSLFLHKTFSTRSPPIPKSTKNSKNFQTLVSSQTSFIGVTNRSDVGFDLSIVLLWKL